MTYTVLGGLGFIGSHLVASLRELGEDCFVPTRNDPGLFDRELGHVIYCIGLTADFRSRPFDTVDAHVCALLPLLQRAQFQSFLYLSSTRVYEHSTNGVETELLAVKSEEPSNLFNISKLMGESICVASRRSNVRIARISNVFGDDTTSQNFLTELIRDALERKKIVLRSGWKSAKDYIGVQEVVEILPKIATTGRHSIYNVASGANVTNRALLDRLAEITGCTVEMTEGAPDIVFPPISIKRLQDEFAYDGGPSVVERLEDLVRRRR